MNIVHGNSVEKSLPDCSVHSPAYLNPGFDERSNFVSAQKSSPATNQSPLELLAQTCRNIGSNLGLDSEPTVSRKRLKYSNDLPESRKRICLSPATQRSRSPAKPTETSSKISVISERDSKAHGLLNDHIVMYPSENKFLPSDTQSSYQDVLNNLSRVISHSLDTAHSLQCTCVNCLLAHVRPFFVDTTSPLQPILNPYLSYSVDPFRVPDTLLVNQYYKNLHRLSCPGIEYCMYCGAHCPSIQTLMDHMRSYHFFFRSIADTNYWGRCV